MAKKQTRRSISVAGTVYSALKARCEKDGTTMSGVVEGLIRAFLELPERQAVKPAIKEPAPKPRLTVVTAKELAPETKWVAAPVSKIEPAPILNDAQRAAAKIFTF